MRLLLWFVLLCSGLLPLGYLAFLALSHPMLPSDLWQAFGLSIALGLWSALLATLVGGGIGFVLAKSGWRGSGIVISLFAINLLLPPDILTFGWKGLGFDGFWGAVAVLGSIYAVIPLTLTFFYTKITPSLEEMGLLFCNKWCTFWHITLPLTAPALVLGFLLVWMLGLGDYSVSNELHTRSIAVVIFTQFGAFYDFSGAAWLSLPLLLTALVMALLFQKLLWRLTTSPPSSASLHYSLKGAWLISLIGVFCCVAPPLLGICAKLRLSTLFEGALLTLQALLPTLGVGLIVSLLLALLGFMAAILLHRQRSRGIEEALFLLFLTPSVVLGVALILWYNRFVPWLYSTIWILVIGYIGKYLLISTKITQNAVRSIPPSLEEAAALCGATPWQRMVWIILPLAKKGLVASFVLSFLFVLRESDLAMLLHPATFSPISVQIATLSANADPSLVAAICFWTILFVAFFIALVGRMARGTL